MNKEFLEYLIESNDITASILMGGYDEIFNENMLDILSAAKRKISTKKDPAVVTGIMKNPLFFVNAVPKKDQLKYLKEFVTSCERWFHSLYGDLPISKDLPYYKHDEIYLNLRGKLAALILKLREFKNLPNLESYGVDQPEIRDTENRLINFYRYQAKRYDEIIRNGITVDQDFAEEELKSLNLFYKV